MVTYSDSVFEMMKTRIENIERMQKRLFTCLSECEAQICQISQHFADGEISDKSSIVQLPLSRVLVKHHGWQWLLGHASLPGNNRPVLVKFDDIIDEKHVSKKQVIDVKNHKCERLAIGLKVLAECNSTEAPGVFYSGTVAEVPDKQNDFRYLVLFDDGTARYCTSQDCYSSPEQGFISSVNEVHKKFIEYYTKMYTEGGFQILDLSKQQSVVVEVNGEWKVCNINFTDCNIANVQVSEEHSENVYCGSYRFGPIYKLLKAHLLLPNTASRDTLAP